MDSSVRTVAVWTTPSRYAARSTATRSLSCCSVSRVLSSLLMTLILSARPSDMNTTMREDPICIPHSVINISGSTPNVFRT